MDLDHTWQICGWVEGATLLLRRHCHHCRKKKSENMDQTFLFFMGWSISTSLVVCKVKVWTCPTVSTFQPKRSTWASVGRFEKLTADINLSLKPTMANKLDHWRKVTFRAYSDLLLWCVNTAEPFINKDQLDKRVCICGLFQLFRYGILSNISAECSFNFVYQPAVFLSRMSNNSVLYCQSLKNQLHLLQITGRGLWTKSC